MRKCGKRKHYPDWNDSDVELYIDYDLNTGNRIVVEACNCECWTKSYHRIYEMVEEREDE